MPNKPNGTGNSNARRRIQAGDVNTSSPWSFPASVGNALLGSDGDDWINYAKWHLGIDPDAELKTKARFKYPFGKDGKVYRSAIRAIRSRSAQQGDDAIFAAAGRLMDLIDREEDGMPKNQIERRYMFVEKLELRSDGDDEPQRLTGYAARFNKKSDNLGGFREIIAPGAFKDTIRTDDVRALWNHNSDFVLGRSSSGTLALEETSKGLKIDVEMPDTTWARDLGVSIKRGDVSQMSFGFRSIKDEWDDSDPDNVVRTLKQVELFDVSPVTYPAYPQTEVQVRSLQLAGMDMDALIRVLIKAEHKLTLTDGDRQAVADITTRLNGLIEGNGSGNADPDPDPNIDPNHEPEQDPNPGLPVSNLRRSLELKLKGETL